MADAVVVFQGWGSSTQGWGDGGWGQNVLVPGMTGAVGSVTVNADANVYPSGLAATGGVGTVTVSADAVVAVTGVQATGAIRYCKCYCRCNSSRHWSRWHR